MSQASAIMRTPWRAAEEADIGDQRGVLQIEAAVRPPREDRCQVEAEAIDVHLVTQKSRLSRISERTTG